MKILLLGNEDFLYSLLDNLSSFSFARENSLHVMVAKTRPKISFRSIRAKLKKLSVDEVLVRINQRIYSRSHSSILSALFPPVKLGKFSGIPSVEFLPFTEPHLISNLGDYDYLIVASYSKKISEETIDKPRLGTINIHPSFLPELRGGYPTYVEAHDEAGTSSVTLHFMSKMFDAGEILDQAREKIDRLATNAARYYNGSKLAAQLLEKWHRTGFSVNSVPQDDTDATYCNKLLIPKNNIRKMEKSDNVERFVKANFIKHLFPFTYFVQGLSCYFVIDLERIELPLSDVLNQKVALGMFSFQDKLYLKYYDSVYLVRKYIKSGRLICT